MDWLRDHLWETWLVVAIVLGVAEMISLELFLAMLATGALAAMVAAILGAPFVVQALIAAGVSVAALGLVRPPLVRRLHSGPDLVLGPDTLIGQRAVVTEAILGLTPGRIKLAGEIWSAVADDPELTLGPGTSVEVIVIQGATAQVRPAGEQAGELPAADE